MKLYSIPYYIDLEGQEINGVKLTTAHVKLFGAIIVHDRMGQGCFADTKTLTEETKISEGRLRIVRSELIRAGLVLAERRNGTTEIEKMTIPDVVFLTLNNRGMLQNCNIDVTKMKQPMLRKCNIDNREATPVLNKILNKNIKNASPRPSASPRLSSSEEEKQRNVFPFDEDVVDVAKESTGGQVSADRRAFAIAGKVYKAMGIDVKPGVKMRNRIASRLSEGYTEEDILGCIAWCEKDDYYGDNRDPMSWTSENAMTKFKLNKETEKERPANDGAGMEVVW